VGWICPSFAKKPLSNPAHLEKMKILLLKEVHAISLLTEVKSTCLSQTIQHLVGYNKSVK